MKLNRASINNILKLSLSLLLVLVASGCGRDVEDVPESSRETYEDTQILGPGENDTCEITRDAETDKAISSNCPGGL